MWHDEDTHFFLALALRCSRPSGLLYCTRSPILPCQQPKTLQLHVACHVAHAPLVYGSHHHSHALLSRIAFLQVLRHSVQLALACRSMQLTFMRPQRLSGSPLGSAASRVRVSAVSTRFEFCRESTTTTSCLAGARSTLAAGVHEGPEPAPLAKSACPYQRRVLLQTDASELSVTAGALITVR